MSLRASIRVWSESRHTATDLLMLLAIADFADDDGKAYPAVSTLAQKCRMSQRNANFILATLKQSGELEVLANEGPGGTNRYRITLCSQPLKAASAPNGSRPLKPASPPSPETGFSPPEAGFTLKPASSPPEAGFPNPLKPASDKQSLNGHEQSGQPLSRPATARKPTCPHAEIVQLYHDTLPEMPRVKLLDAKGRKAKVAEFWRWVLTSTRSDGVRRATTANEALAWIRSYFERARENDFVMGRTTPSSSHPRWRAHFDYVLSDKGKVQIIERTEQSA